MTQILVTGANGFVGSAILHRLVAEGHDVVGLVRKTSDLKRLHDLSDAGDLTARLRFADLADASSLQEAVNGCGTIIHSAAHASDWGSRKRFVDANVSGVSRIIDALESASVDNTPGTAIRDHAGAHETGKRLILISSANVAGFGGLAIDENDRGVKNRFRYSRTKLEGERVAPLRCKEQGIRFQILRPGAVYGPGDWKWSYQMLSRIQNGKWPLMDRGKAVFSPLFIDNLTYAVTLALERPEVSGIFNITDDRSIDWESFSKKAAESIGVELKSYNFPSSLSYATAVALELVFLVLRMKRPPLITRYRVVRASRNFDYSCKKAKRELSYAPDTRIERHMAQTADWYRRKELETMG